MRAISVFLFFAWFGAAPLARAAQLPTAVLVVEEGDVVGQHLGRLVERRLQGEVRIRWIVYSETELADSIYKGKFLATLQAARLVVAIGDDSALLALAEVEETPVYFVSSQVPGSALAEGHVSGLLSYSAQDALAAMPAAWKSGLDLLYSPGYEPAVEEIRAAAKAAGFDLIPRRVGRRRELPAVVRTLLGSARAVWLLGDPMLSRGAGFEFLSEQTLSRSVPLVGAGFWEVKNGAVFCSRGRPEALARQASRTIAGLMAGRPAQPRLELAEPGGSILYNKSLAAHFGLSPRPPVWQEIQ